MSANREKIVELLENWVKSNAHPDGWDWFVQKRENLLKSQVGSDRHMFMAMGQIFRKLGKKDLVLSEDDFDQAGCIREKFTPKGWTIDQAARLALLLGSTSEDKFSERLETLCRSADISELLTYYRGLPLYPHQEKYIFRATEGLRSNIKSVFESVAHNNPYPSEQFDANAWNQMVLKAIFIGSRLDLIIGFDHRANKELAQMLSHYAHERWAASRVVTPELWRAVGPYAHMIESGISDLEKVLKSGTEIESQAARLALKTCPASEAKEILKLNLDANSHKDNDSMTWASISEKSNLN